MTLRIECHARARFVKGSDWSHLCSICLSSCPERAREEGGKEGEGGVFFPGFIYLITSNFGPALQLGKRKKETEEGRKEGREDGRKENALGKTTFLFLKLAQGKTQCLRKGREEELKKEREEEENQLFTLINKTDCPLARFREERELQPKGFNPFLGPRRKE